MNKKRQIGFTLFELLVVISIVSGLATVALNHLLWIQKEARSAKLNLTRSAVNTAANLVHSLYLSRQQKGDTAICAGSNDIADNINHICVEGGLIAIVNGYPQALIPSAGNGIISAAGFSSSISPSLEELKRGGYTFSGGGNAQDSKLVIQVLGGEDSKACSFTYTPSSSATGGPAIVSPIVTDGC